MNKTQAWAHRICTAAQRMDKGNVWSIGDFNSFVLDCLKEFELETRTLAISKAWGAPSKQEALKRLEEEDNG